MRDDTPADIVVLILQSLPNLDALHSTIQVSRHVNTAFATHTQSIYRAVARAEVGPMFEQAAKLAIMQSRGSDIRWDLHSSPVRVSGVPSEKEVDSLRWDQSLAKAFGEITQTAEALQALYSRWYVDVSSSVSVLTPEESAQFNQAMYCFMLFWTIFKPAWTDFENLRHNYTPWAEVYQAMKLQDAQVLYISQAIPEKGDRSYFAALDHFLCEAGAWSGWELAPSSQPVRSSELWHGIAKIATQRSRHNYLYTYQHDYGSFQHMMHHRLWAVYDHHRSQEWLSVYDAHFVSYPGFQRACAACLNECVDGVWFEPISNVYNHANWALFYRNPFTAKHLLGTSPIFASLRRSMSMLELLQLILEHARGRGEMRRSVPWLCHACIVRIIEKYRRVVRWKLLMAHCLGRRGDEKG